MRLQPADLLLDPRSAWSSTCMAPDPDPSNKQNRIGEMRQRQESAILIRSDSGPERPGMVFRSVVPVWQLLTHSQVLLLEHALRVDNLHKDKGMHARRTFPINKLLIQSRAIASEMTSVIS